MQSTETMLRVGVMHRILSYARQKKYEILLLSFMLLIFGNTFTDHLRIAGIIDICQNMIVGMLVFYDKKWLRNTVLLLIIASALLNLIAPRLGFIDVKSWQGIIYLVFFTLVAVGGVKKVVYAKRGLIELVSASPFGFCLTLLVG